MLVKAFGVGHNCSADAHFSATNEMARVVKEE